ncbi:MAG TPA: hypothetical protein VF195_10850, partial [Actinomycetota bacterium]
LKLIGESLRESFSVQLDVPMDDRWIIGRHDGPEFVTRHSQCVQDLDRARFLIGIDVLRPHPAVPIRPVTCLSSGALQVGSTVG